MAEKRVAGRQGSVKQREIVVSVIFVMTMDGDANKQKKATPARVEHKSGEWLKSGVNEK